MLPGWGSMAEGLRYEVRYRLSPRRGPARSPVLTLPASSSVALSIGPPMCVPDVSPGPGVSSCGQEGCVPRSTLPPPWVPCAVRASRVCTPAGMFYGSPACVRPAASLLLLHTVPDGLVASQHFPTSACLIPLSLVGVGAPKCRPAGFVFRSECQALGVSVVSSGSVAAVRRGSG